MLAIYKRELKAFFQGITGLLFIGVTLFFMGLYFTVYGLLNGYPYFSYVVSGIVFLFILTVPVLTMRLLAEERKTKTDQLILTSPVSVGGIILGKYLAVLTVFLIPVGICCLYPLIMGRYGTVPMGEAYLSILGYFLFGAACIAVGLFVSALTESQVIAAVLGFAALFIGYMMPSICSIISSTGNWITKILGCYDLYTPFSNFMQGTLDVGSCVYYISFIGLMLFLTTQSVQKRRYSVSVKNLSFSAYSTGMIAVVLAIVVILNMVVANMPSQWTSVDLTYEKLYTLTDQTKEYLAQMQEDVTIYVIAAEDNADTTLKQTLDRYESLSEHIKVEYVDPTVNPRFSQQYTDSSVSADSLIVVSDKRSRVINYSDIYETSFDYSTYSSSTTGYDGEGQITSALDYVLADDMPKVYMTQGHGEVEFAGSFTSALSKENVEAETINLLNYDAVPEDASCLFINGAGSDFSADDKDKVIAYLENGGKVVISLIYHQEATPNLDAILSYMGLSVTDGMIVETDTNQYYRVPYYLLPEVSYSTYTSNIVGNYYIFAPYAQGIKIQDEEAEGMSYQEFLTTSDKSFSKNSLENMNDFDKAEEDEEGPFAIGVEAVKTLEDKEATMVVFGTYQIFTEDTDAMVSGANLQMFTNTVSAFVDHEVSISIPVKNYEVSYLTVKQTDAVLIGLITIVIMPLGCLIAGFVIWFRRRRR